MKPTRRRAKRYLSALEQRAADAGLSDRLLVAFELPLSPALRHNVIIVRPTRSEGDALSVREGLSAGVPVIATDVVERPSGTVTFRRDDIPGLCAAVLGVIHASAPSGDRRRFLGG
jgi:glycosyltransferase involved in cell wall biosynthesis